MPRRAGGQIEVGRRANHFEDLVGQPGVIRPVRRVVPGPVESCVKPSGAPGLCVWAQSRSGAKFAPCFRSA